MLTKRIEYAYPSSPLATKLGFGKTGCWCVTQMENDVQLAKVSGFKLYHEAVRNAEMLSGEYDNYSTNVYHAKTGFVNAPEEVRTFHLKEQTS